MALLSVVENCGDFMKREWYHFARFSLRTGLILVTLFCIWFGFFVQSVRKQHRAVQVIEQSGGWVGYDYAWDNGDWIKGGGKSWAPRWVLDLVGKDALHQVVAVNFPALFHSAYDENGAAYTGPDPQALMTTEQWKAIGDLKSTEWISLNARMIFDSELENLNGLTCLEEIKMEAVPIDGSGLKHFLPLKNLKHLTLSRVHLLDEHADLLLQFQTLEGLGLNDSTVSEEQAEKLKQQLPDCKIFYSHWPPKSVPANEIWKGGGLSKGQILARHCP